MLRDTPDQKDFFDAPVFESRRATPLALDRFRARMRQAMTAAIRQSGVSRDAIVAQMAAMPGGAMSGHMLDAYTSEAKGHDIPLSRFKALARVARAPFLWDVAVADDGLIVLEGDEARLAEIARLQQAQRELKRRIAVLLAAPVQIQERRP